MVGQDIEEAEAYATAIQGEVFGTFRLMAEARRRSFAEYLSILLTLPRGWATRYARMPRSTLPCTSVKRKSRPL
jgi:hypothetical protein